LINFLPIRGHDGDDYEIIHLILSNFGEMNKLWVRMQYQTMQSGDQRAELERRDLKVLVGFNLLLIREMTRLTGEIYITKVLPPVFEHVFGCKNALAQEYIIQCLIEVTNTGFYAMFMNIFISPKHRHFLTNFILKIWSFSFVFSMISKKRSDWKISSDS
jgi:vacuolar protein sorting-associated protein 35